MRKWYRFAAQADGLAVDLYIYGDIGASYSDDNAVTAKQFMADLAALSPAVVSLFVHVNSLGGDVFEAVAIANALRTWGAVPGRTVTATVDGIAASMGSVVIMAGQTIQIADNGLVMVHNPWGIVMGNAAELRRTADALDVVRDTLVTTYQWHSALSEAELIALMDAETWMDADTAIANGFATEKVAGLKVAARLDPRAAAKLTIPAPFQNRVSELLESAPAAPVAASATDVLRLCREGEVHDLAEGLITAGATLDVVRASISEAKATRAAAAARATEITTLCAKAKLPELADGYIAGAMTTEAIKAHLLTLTAKLDAVEIDGSLDPSHGSKPKTRIDAAAIYAARNGLTTKKE